MPSIRQGLATTRSARWYTETRGAQQRTAWAERVRCYDALTAVLAEHAAGAAGAVGAAEGDAPATPADGLPCGPAGRRHGQPPIGLSGLVALVARRAYFAGAEPVYRRFRQLLAMPTASPADRLTRTVAELPDRIGQGGCGDALSAEQAARLLSMIGDFTVLLAGGGTAAAETL